MLIDFSLFVKIKKLNTADYMKLIKFVDGCVAREELSRNLKDADSAALKYAVACESAPGMAEMIEGSNGE